MKILLFSQRICPELACGLENFWVRSTRQRPIMRAVILLHRRMKIISNRKGEKLTKPRCLLETE